MLKLEFFLAQLEDEAPASLPERNAAGEISSVADFPKLQIRYENYDIF